MPSAKVPLCAVPPAVCQAMLPVYCGALMAVVLGMAAVTGAVTQLSRAKSLTATDGALTVMVKLSV